MESTLTWSKPRSCYNQSIGPGGPGGRPGEQDEPNLTWIVGQIYRSCGDIPFNVDAIQPSRASCGFSSFLAESSIATEGEQEIRHFLSREEAVSFMHHFSIRYAHGLFVFIDRVLESQGPTGKSGWKLLVLKELTGEMNKSAGKSIGDRSEM